MWVILRYVLLISFKSIFKFPHHGNYFLFCVKLVLMRHMDLFQWARKIKWRAWFDAAKNAREKWWNLNESIYSLYNYNIIWCMQFIADPQFLWHNQNPLPYGNWMYSYTISCAIAFTLAASVYFSFGHFMWKKNIWWWVTWSIQNTMQALYYIILHF